MKAVLNTTYNDAQIRALLGSLSITDCKAAISFLKRRIEQTREDGLLKKVVANNKSNFLHTPVEQLYLSPRMLNSLKENGFRTVSDIADVGIEKLKTYKGIR